MKSNIYIFTEAGDAIGFGHLTRCLALYEKINSKSINVKIIINGENFEKNLFNIDYEKKDWRDIEYLSKTLNKNDYAIIDSYLADKEIYNFVSLRCKKVLYIDDNMRINYPKGIVVNPSIYSKKLPYLRNEDIEYLLGKDYIILRKEFLTPSNRIKSGKVKNVLVTLGGTDPRNLTPKVIKILKEIDSNINIKVIVGNGFENLEEIEKQVDSKVKLFFNLKAQEMKEAMENSDFVISACGQTIYELLALKIPFLPIIVIDNQINNGNGLLKLGIKPIMFDLKNLQKEVANRLKGPFIIDDTVDGKGSDRIIDIFLSDIKIRDVKKEDCIDVFNLSNEKSVRDVSLNQKLISFESHKIWFDKIISSDKCRFYIITDLENNFLGQVRFNIEDITATISISLTPKVRGKGIGSNVLLLSIDKLEHEVNSIETIIAFVREENKKSIKLFIKNKFKTISSDKGVVCFERKLK